MSINSRRKGKVGELELSKFLTARGFTARRGQQFSGNPDAPDVVCPDLKFHIECKRCQRTSLRDWIAQAQGDAGDRPWVIFHRWNDGPWLVTLLADEFLNVVRESEL